MGNKAGGKSEDQLVGRAEWFKEGEGREGKIELEINRLGYVLTCSECLLQHEKAIMNS